MSHMTGTDCKTSPLYMEPLRENLVFKKNEVKYISEYSSHLWRILMKLPHAHEYFRSYEELHHISRVQEK